MKFHKAIIRSLFMISISFILCGCNLFHLDMPNDSYEDESYEHDTTEFNSSNSDENESISSVVANDTKCEDATLPVDDEIALINQTSVFQYKLVDTDKILTFNNELQNDLNRYDMNQYMEHAYGEICDLEITLRDSSHTDFDLENVDVYFNQSNLQEITTYEKILEFVDAEDLIITGKPGISITLNDTFECKTKDDSYQFSFTLSNYTGESQANLHDCYVMSISVSSIRKTSNSCFMINGVSDSSLLDSHNLTAPTNIAVVYDSVSDRGTISYEWVNPNSKYLSESLWITISNSNIEDIYMTFDVYSML